MNTTTTRSPLLQPATTQEQEQQTPDVAPESTQAVVQAIRRDCLADPDLYLEESRVPFGGE